MKANAVHMSHIMANVCYTFAYTTQIVHFKIPIDVCFLLDQLHVHTIEHERVWLHYSFDVASSSHDDEQYFSPNRDNRYTCRYFTKELKLTADFSGSFFFLARLIALNWRIWALFVTSIHTWAQASAQSYHRWSALCHRSMIDASAIVTLILVLVIFSKYPYCLELWARGPRPIFEWK